MLLTLVFMYLYIIISESQHDSLSTLFTKHQEFTLIKDKLLILPLHNAVSARIIVKTRNSGISFSVVTRETLITTSSSQLSSLIALLVAFTLNIPAGVHALNPLAFLAPSLAAPIINVTYLVLFSRHARDARTLTYDN